MKFTSVPNCYNSFSPFLLIVHLLLHLWLCCFEFLIIFFVSTVVRSPVASLANNSSESNTVPSLEDLPGNPQTTHAVAETKTCSLKTDFGALLLRTIPTQLIEQREVEQMPTWSLHPYVLVSLV